MEKDINLKKSIMDLTLLNVLLVIALTFGIFTLVFLALAELKKLNINRKK